jgi:catechol 2,3-dioxygenase-like lactoylglutathione lyase family enzyme
MHEPDMDRPGRPEFLAVDHVSWTVPDLDAAVRFFCTVFGARERYRLGPLDAADMPLDERGRDWTDTHVNVPGARLRLAMLSLLQNLDLQLVQYDKPLDRRTSPPRNCDAGGHHIGIKVNDVAAAASYLAAHGCKVMQMIEIQDGPLAGKTNVYVLDPWGHQLELVD